jgi:uncharacterized membrane protein HdeD (DUF308 family)
MATNNARLLNDRLNVSDTRMQTSLLAQSWWALALRGALAIIAGVIAFLLPGVTVAALALLLAAYFVADGALAIVAAVRAARQRKRWWPFVLEGLVGIGVGAVAIFWPGMTMIALVYFVAVWAIFTGVLMSVAGSYVEGPPRWLLVLSGALSVVLGIIMISLPLAGIVAVAWWFGAYALLSGISLVALGLRLRGGQRLTAA